MKTIKLIIAVSLGFLLFSCQSNKISITVIIDETTSYQIDAEKGYIIESLETPEKDQYIFSGWFESPSDVEMFDLSIPVTKNTTLYADWASEGLLYEYDSDLDGYIVSLGTALNSIIRVPKYYLNKRVVSIKDNGFALSPIDSIYLPPTLRSIGKRVFLGSSVHHVLFTEGSLLQTIEEAAFMGSINLESFILPDQVTSIGKLAFNQTNQLTTFSISESSLLESVGLFAFAHSKINSVYIPEHVSEIGYGAFAFNEQLAHIDVSDNNEILTSVDGILFSKSQNRLIIYPGGKTDTSYTVPSSVITIDPYAFSGNQHIEDISIGDAVSQIGFIDYTNVVTEDTLFAGAFFDTNELREINVSENNPIFTSEDGILYDKDKTKLISYPSNHNLESFIAPSSVVEVCYHAFAFTNLLRLYLPITIDYIRSHAFVEASSLTLYTDATSLPFYWIIDDLSIQYDISRDYFNSLS